MLAKWTRQAIWGPGCDVFGSRVLPQLMRPLPVLTRLDQPTPVLTFDDGPHPDSTPALLDVLAEFDRVATFFVVGTEAARYPNLVQRIAGAGHAIGNHSWSHRSAWRLSPRVQAEEFFRTQQAIEDLTGQRCDRVRPPFGLLTPTWHRLARREQADIWMWSRMPPDYRPTSSSAVIASDLQKARGGEIVCLHENAAARSRTPTLVRQWLRADP